MKWVTHQAAALAAGLCAQADAALCAAMVGGAIVPDMVEQIVARGDRAVFARIHRGIFHWFGLYAAAFVLACTLDLPPTQRTLIAGLALGALSHLILDGLNPTGVPLTPFRREPRLRLGVLATGSAAEYVLLMGLFALIALAGYRLEASWLRRAAQFFTY